MSRRAKPEAKPATRLTVAKWIKIIEQRKADVGKLRDQIRDNITEMGELHDTCQRAFDDLEHAIDALSELA